MKRVLPLLLALTLITTTASAQSTRSVGIGISLNSSGLTTSLLDDVDAVLSPVNIYLPITLPNVRIEPEVGIFRLSESNESTSYRQTGLQIGTGLFGTQMSDEMLFYFGGRVGLLLNSSSSEYDGEIADDFETSQTNLYLAPALGAEYYFGDYFSLGGEAQLMYLRAGNQQIDGEDVEEDTDGSLIRSRALIFVRWHL